jgi:molecular chaperone GrpE
VSPREDEREREPVTITDRRRIDPETGRARVVDTAAADVDPSEPPVVEPPVGAPHDAEPSLAEEAALLGEVLDAEVTEEGALDPVQLELAERTADLQRVSAEYANYRRRVDRDRQSVVDGAKAQVAVALIGVLDDLDRARSHGDLEGPLKAVADKLVDALTGQGLASYGAVGDAFDPALHEAVSHSGDGGAPVLDMVMRQGYRFGERVLRPAMVAVTEDAQQETPVAQDEQ